MINWFHTLPNVGVFLVIAGLVGLPMVLAPHIVGWLTRRAHHEGVASGAWEAAKLIVASAGAVLAFSLVQVQGNLRNAEEVVMREANALTTADRHLARFGQAEADAIRPHLRAYAATIIQDDWPVMAAGLHAAGIPGRAASTDQAYNAVSVPARSLHPAGPRQEALFNELLKALDDISDARETRLSAAHWSLPGLFWWTVLAIMAVLIGLFALMERSAERTLALIGIASGLSLMLSLVVVIDGPFDGETSVQPIAIARAMDAMDRRK